MLIYEKCSINLLATVNPHSQLDFEKTIGLLIILIVGLLGPFYHKKEWNSERIQNNF
jgi:hypothetical protein